MRVGDIDVLVLGTPDRDQLYEAVASAENHLGRQVQATIRDAGWLSSGSGFFSRERDQPPDAQARVGKD